MISPAAEIRADFLTALVDGDAKFAEIVALDAVGEGMSVADLYVDVIAPVLVEIGHQWAGGRLTVADEHLATGIAYDVMRLVSRTATTHPRRSRERLLLAAVGSEDHVVGLRMLGDLAEARGFDVRFLGAAVPVETLADIVGKHEPEIIGLSVTMAASAARLADALDRIAASAHAPAGVLVGGRGVSPELAARPGVHHASDARSGIEVIERLAAAAV